MIVFIKMKRDDSSNFRLVVNINKHSPFAGETMYAPLLYRRFPVPTNPETIGLIPVLIRMKYTRNKLFVCILPLLFFFYLGHPCFIKAPPTRWSNGTNAA